MIMPTYNHAKFIGKAIESVLNQTYKDIELIIIDNYSKDDTEKIVTSYKDNRISYLKFRNNGVIAASRNYGIKYSQGDYIAFLDSDDLWLPEKLEKQVGLLKRTNEIAMVYTRYKIIKEGIISSKIFPKEGKCKSGNIFKSLYLRPFIACSSVMVKRSVLAQVGFFSADPDLIAIEDTDLWLRISLKYRIKCTNGLFLIFYRIHSKSVSQGYIQNVRRSLLIKKRYKKYTNNFLFWKAVLLSIACNCKRKVMPQIM